MKNKIFINFIMFITPDIIISYIIVYYILELDSVIFLLLVFLALYVIYIIKFILRQITEYYYGIIDSNEDFNRIYKLLKNKNFPNPLDFQNSESYYEGVTNNIDINIETRLQASHFFHHTKEDNINIGHNIYI